EMITCTGRFSGVAFDLMVPVVAVIGIFAKETGQGLVFQGEDTQSPPPASNAGADTAKPKSTRPQLKIIK
ncbi:MAG: ClpXP protease specificity-enhancing factor SspB, partial [Gallionella sp.]